MKTTYTCVGSVCGSCGVEHRTIEAAARHAGRHARSIRSAYPRSSYSRVYGDRRIVAVEDGQTRGLTDREIARAVACAEVGR